MPLPPTEREEVSRELVATTRRYRVVTRVTAYEERFEDVVECPTPDGSDLPAPPAFEPTPETVAHWDWDNTTIYPKPDGAPAIGPVAANDTLPDGTGAHAIVTETAGGHAVELAVNHDLVGRPDGTAARLFLRNWSFWIPHRGKRLIVDYAVYLPDAIVISAGGSLGLGLQTKHATGVIWALDAENGDGGLRPWVWNPVGAGVVKPLAEYVYPIGRWAHVRVESRLHESDGDVNIWHDGEHTFRFEGRTLPGGLGLALYSVNASHGWVRALFSDVRMDVVP